MTATVFLHRLEELLELEPGTIRGDEVLRDAGWWESMNAILFIALADSELDVGVTGADLARCRTVPDLLALLGDRITAPTRIAS